MAAPAGAVSPGATRPCARAGRGDGVHLTVKLVGGMLYSTCTTLCTCQQQFLFMRPGLAPGWPGAHGEQVPGKLLGSSFYELLNVNSVT